VIGSYKLLQQIGEGGFGVVFMRNAAGTFERPQSTGVTSTSLATGDSTNHRAVGTILNVEPYVSFEYYAKSDIVEGTSGTKPMTVVVEFSAASDTPVTVD
jgi:hypothetical protein